MNELERKKALNRNIKVISAVILALFMGIMGYMLYFHGVQAEEIAAKPGNVREQAKRNEILRGTIFDRNGKVLTYSERQSDNTQKRIYQGAEAFAQVLGYEQRNTVTGLEYALDDILTKDEFVFDFSKEGFLEMLKDPSSVLNRTKEGNSVVTTLDQELQWRAYDLLGDELGEKGAIVAMNPKTGEILAMVNRPSYDPNGLKENYASLNEKQYDDGVFLNTAARGSYAPGSTYKIITLLAALEKLDGIEERTFKDNGKLDVNVGKDLPNVNGTIHGNIKLKEAFAVSSNVVFGTLAIELGGESLAEVAERFGFNKEQSFPFLNMSTSKAPKYPKNEDGALAASGVGQTGVSASPLQMAMVASAIANDGNLMTPMMVNSVLKYDGTQKEKFEPKLYNTVADTETAQTVKTYMKNNVDTSKNETMKALAKLRGAGKTGTAQDFYQKTDGTKIEVVNSWFVGFAPYEDPQIAVAVVVLDGGSGGGKAASIATELMRWYTENR